MKNINKMLRLLGLVVLILLALSGVGIIGNFNRERYIDKRVTTEQLVKKELESEAEKSEIKNS